MTPEQAAERARWTAERQWSTNKVCDTLCTAWAAKPRTTEHTAIMLWPTLHIPVSMPGERYDAYDLRISLHMLGLHHQDPEAYKLRVLIRDRLGWSYNRWRRVHRRACAIICERLNGGAVPLVIRAIPRSRLSQAGSPMLIPT